MAGIIVPGPELKKRIDTLAARLVGRPDMVEKLLKSEKRHECQFLVDGHEFHPYYLDRMAEFKANPAAADELRGARPPGEPTPAPEAVQAAPGVSAVERALKAATEDGALKEDPHPSRFGIAPGSLNSTLPQMELDIIRVAAQYTAKLGDEFLDGLRAKHGHRARDLEFLSPDHPRHQLFRALRAAYETILAFPPSVEQELEAGSGDAYLNSIIAVCEEKKRFADAELARKRAAELTETELMHRLLWDQFTVTGRFGIEDLGLGRAPAPAAAAAVTQATVVDAYAPVARARTAAQTQVVDAQGNVLSAAEATGHVRAQTVAPKYLEDQALQQKRQREDGGALASEAELERNLGARFGAR